MLSLGWLYTYDTNDDDNDAANNNDNDTRWANHNCIGSLSCMPNEPKSTRHIDFIIHVGSDVHMCTKYEVSIIKPVARRTVHTPWWHQTMPDDANDTRRIIPVFTGSLAFVPIELTSDNIWNTIRMYV